MLNGAAHQKSKEKQIKDPRDKNRFNHFTKQMSREILEMENKSVNCKQRNLTNNLLMFMENN